MSIITPGEGTWDAPEVLYEHEVDAAEQVLAERHLHDFVRQAWHLVEARPFIDSWHVGAVCEHLEAVSLGQIPKLLINMPPRMSKSLLVCVFWFCWDWLRFPWKRWMFSSYAQALSTRDSIRCRHIISSPWYRRRWGARFELLHDQNQKVRFDNTRTGFRLATSVGGLGTGEGGDYLVFDDPHNVVDGESDAERESVINWYTQSQSTRGNDAKKVARVGVMQRLNVGDLSGWCLEQGDWTHLMLPMRFEKDRRCTTVFAGHTWTDPREKEGELLCPERVGEKEASELARTLGPRGEAGQLQQRPTVAGGSVFKSAHFLYYTVRPLNTDLDGRHNVTDVDPQLRMVLELTLRNGQVKRWFGWDLWWFQACDTATEDGDDNAYTVVGTYGVTPDWEICTWDIARERLSIPEQYPYLIRQRQRYPFLDLQAVEKASSGPGIIQLGRSQGLPFHELIARGSKSQRAETMSIYYANGMVFHPVQTAERPAPWLEPYQTELTNFPNGPFKDQADVDSYAGLIVVEKAAGGPGIRTGTEEEMRGDPADGSTGFDTDVEGERW